MALRSTPADSGSGWEVSEYHARRPPRARGRRRERRRWLVTLAVPLVVLGGLAALVLLALGRGAGPGPPSCVVGGYPLSPAQAANAATIAAVGDRLGLPARAVTVALATALQESQLDNVDYGTSDSLGLFQQRPSQGWGSPAEIMDPTYAATAFYQRLVGVAQWSTLAVAVAAQAVQHSADGSAYADWVGQAQSMADSLTGRVGAGVSCSGLTGPVSPGTATPAGLSAAAATALGPGPVLDSPAPPGRGWQVASWMVANASAYGLTAVAFDGLRWTRATGVWRPDRAAGPAVTVA